MRKIVFGALTALLFAMVWSQMGHAAGLKNQKILTYPWKFLVKKTMADACLPGLTSRVQRTGAAAPSITVAGSACDGDWTTGSTFNQPIRAVLLGNDPTRLCDSEMLIYGSDRLISNAAFPTKVLPGGKKATIVKWVCDEETDQNPCAIGDSLYQKCTGEVIYPDMNFTGYPDKEDTLCAYCDLIYEQGHGTNAKRDNAAALIEQLINSDDTYTDVATGSCKTSPGCSCTNSSGTTWACSATWND